MVDKKILVYYISVVNIVPEKIGEYITEISNKISAESISEHSEIIFIPIFGETRVECINPKYITDTDLIKKHERLMSELHEHLNDQVVELKEKKDGE